MPDLASPIPLVTGAAASQSRSDASVSPRAMWLATALLVLSAVLLGLQLTNPVMGDIPYYRSVGQKLLHGEPLYGAQPLEYPPYVLLWWILPALTGSVRAFLVVFGLQLLVIDLAAKRLLLLEGRRLSAARWWMPTAVFTVTSLLLGYVYLKRFDLVPAALVLFGTVQLFRGRPLSSGLLIAAGIATKFYPVVLVPLFAVVTWRRQQLGRWLAGVGLGLAPLIILAFFLRWWRFPLMHEGRGLQVESLYAGVLWLAHRLGGLDVAWVRAVAATELQGPAAAMTLRAARVVWVVTVLFSAGLSIARAWRGVDDIGRFARLALLPLLAFVAFNFVLSPQYLIWLTGLMALAVTIAWDWPITLLLLAVAAGPLSYPAVSYYAGYDLPHVLGLCLRNFLLVGAWIGFVLRPAP